ncbi:hypothetical protein [Viscerimonas tarda]
MNDELLYRFIAGKTTPAEDEIVAGWIEFSEENFQYFQNEVSFFNLINWNMGELAPELSWEDFIVKYKIKNII